MKTVILASDRQGQHAPRARSAAGAHLQAVRQVRRSRDTPGMTVEVRHLASDARHSLA
jgi:hypothetical protein